MSGAYKAQGLGKMRHLHTNYFRIQEKSARKDLTFKKALGTDNPADLLTKYLGSGIIKQHITTPSWEVRESRAVSAPKTQKNDNPVDIF